MTFWKHLQQPIIGLSPMDGVSDASFRYITAKYGKPSFCFTEFTSVEGIQAGAERLLDDFLYSEIERPIIAQLFGSSPDAFYKGTIVAAALGFEGVDINMGCPSKTITSRGAGAALINEPEHAKEIVLTCKKALTDWKNGLTLTEAEVPQNIISKIQERFPQNTNIRPKISLSVKTRLGYREFDPAWLDHVLSFPIDALFLHGRTYKQLYSGEAIWDFIAATAQIAKTRNILLIGNGDLKNRTQAIEYITKYQVDGGLIGRSALGNPWVFQGTVPSFEDKMRVALEHSRYFYELSGERGFVRIRKHLVDYIKGEEDAKEIRKNLMAVNNLQDIEDILQPILKIQ